MLPMPSQSKDSEKKADLFRYPIFPWNVDPSSELPSLVSGCALLFITFEGPLQTTLAPSCQFCPQAIYTLIIKSLQLCESLLARSTMNSGSSPSRRPSGSPSRSPSRAGAPGASTPRRGSISEPLRRTASQRSLAANQAGHPASLPRQPQNAHTARHSPNGILPESPRVTQQPPSLQRPVYERRNSPLNTRKVDTGIRRGVGKGLAWVTVPIPFVAGIFCCGQCTTVAKNYLKCVDSCCTDCGCCCIQYD